VAEILRLLAASWIDLTRGPLGVVVLPAPFPGADWVGMSSQASILAAALCLMAAVVLVLHRLLRSPYGRAWAAIRQSLPLAESIGIPTLSYRVACIGLSGGIAALAGALPVPKIFVLTPDLFGAQYSATGLLAVVLGGRATLVGPLLGGAIFALLPEGLRSIEQVRLAVFAALLLIAVRTLPGGIASMLKRPVRQALPAVVPSCPSPHLATPRISAAGHDVLLKVEGLSKRYGGVEALKNVGFAVRPGEVLGLIGPNGAGKTTCLSLLSGAGAPTSGSILFNGMSIEGASSHAVAARGLARTFQATTLFGDMSVRDNIMVATHLAAKESPWAAILRSRGFVAREKARAALADAILHRVGLAARADATADALAYGEQRLLAIALALATRPLLLLLDEPAAGLNHSEALTLVDLLRQLRSEGLTVIVIDHNLKMMMALCHRIVVLHHGEKLAEGEPAAVRQNPEVVRAYLGSTDGETAHAGA
jgi:branched-chain amino acid transport system permease protein